MSEGFDPGLWILAGGAALLGVVALAAWKGERGELLGALGELPQNLRLETRDGALVLLGAPEGDVRLSYLAQGGFANAYREVGGAGRVFVVVPEYVRDKDAAADAYATVGAANPHLPAVRRFGRMMDGSRVYVMPYYNTVRRVHPRAWEDQMTIDECEKETFGAECRGEFGRRDPILARQDFVLACAERAGVTPGVVAALEEILAAGAKYSDEWGIDPNIDNFGVDADGRLVLLDLIWDGKAARKFAELEDSL